MTQTRLWAAALQATVYGWGGDQVVAILQDRAIKDPDPLTRAAGLQAIAQDRDS